MFLRKHTLAVPLILAAFTAGKPASAQATCIPDICAPDCNPAASCDPDCFPSRPCGPDTGICGPDRCRPASRR
jgi:hypothetical protein